MESYKKAHPAEDVEVVNLQRMALKPFDQFSTDDRNALRNVKAFDAPIFKLARQVKRAERIVRQYGERAETPEKRLRDKDKRRAAYYQFYTDMEWGDARNYHVSLDSGVLGIEKCVGILTELY